MNSAGELLRIQLRAVGAAGTSSVLTLARGELNEGTTAAVLTHGQVNVALPATDTPTPGVTPATDTPTPGVTPATDTPTPGVTPATDTPTPDVTPATDTPTPGVTPATDTPTPGVTPATETPTPGVTPATETPTPGVTPTTDTPTPGVTPATDTPTPGVTPAIDTPTPGVTPATDTPTPGVTPATDTPTPGVTPATSTPIATPTDVAQVEVQPEQSATLSFTTTRNLTTTLVIEPNAVSQPVQLTFVELAALNGEAGEMQLVGRFFRLTAHHDGQLLENFVFLIPIRLVLEYRDEDLNGVAEENLELRYYHAATGEWRTDGIVVVERDLVRNLITVTIAHLTEFALSEAERQLFLPVIVR